jgi:hypothetical protein
MVVEILMKLRVRGLVVSMAFLGAACATAVAPASPSYSSTPGAPDQTIVRAIPTPNIPASTAVPEISGAPTTTPVTEPTTSLVPTPEPTETSTPIPSQPLTTKVAAQTEPDFENPISDILRELNPSGPKAIDPSRFMQLLSRDGIEPIYFPRYATAHNAELDSEDLIIGVSIAGEHRAYPIRTLQFNEMANDELGGVPILVTW